MLTYLSVGACGEVALYEVGVGEDQHELTLKMEIEW